MNWIGSIALWSLVQITVFSLIGAAVYLLARRRGAATGSVAALSVLLTLLLVSAMALSPWPQWWSVSASRSSAPETTADSAKTAQVISGPVTPSATLETVAGLDSRVARAPDAALSQEQWASLRSVFWSAFAENARETTETSTHAVWRWPAWLAVVLCLGVAIALTRVAIGLGAVHWYRRKTRPVADAALIDLLHEIRARMSCARDVELRESEFVSSPATIGLRKPLLLLPMTWRQWSDQEQRVVLAHEVAHICRGDYTSWLLAQFSLALHFYHPVVHWLVSRLRMEQEVAADNLGALVVGGRATYLTTLAQMALREDDKAVSWAARPFLPSRGTFLRRIAMLRDTRQRPHAPLGWSGRSAVMVLLLSVGLFVAGIRGPQSAAAQPEGDLLAQSEKADSSTPKADPKTSNDNAETNLNYIPADAALVVVIKPNSLAAIEGIGPLKDFLNSKEGLGLGVPVESLQQVTIAHTPPAQATPAETRLVLYANEAVDWKSEFIDKHLKDASAVEDAVFRKTYYKAPGDAQPHAALVMQYCYYVADDRTLVIDREEGLRELFAKPEGAANAAWTTNWKSVGDRPFAAMLDVAEIAVNMPPHVRDSPQFAPFLPIFDGTRFAYLGIAPEANGAEAEQLTLKLVAECRTEANAKSVAETFEALLILGKNMLPIVNLQVRQAPPELRKMTLEVAGIAEELLGQDNVDVNGRTVVWEAKSNFSASTLAVMIPAIESARTAARNTVSLNNLKQIALAMHNYHDTYGHFPAANVLGPDGKTVHSWRVALLPFLEQSALYNMYKLDEPWDSENNLKVLSHKVPVYQSPDDDRGGNTTSYFVPTGPETMFAAAEGAKFQDITDGTSNTLMVVEAERDIPWTKPEDIVVDTSKPLPKFGGYNPVGFNVAFADGSAKLIRSDISADIVKALLTRAGGEVVNYPLP